jgi:hypothetical protein
MGTPASGESLRPTLGHISVSAFALAGIVIAKAKLNYKTRASNVSGA